MLAEGRKSQALHGHPRWPRATIFGSHESGWEPTPGPAHLRQGGYEMRILVVDDEDQILQLATSMLESEGHEVVTASQGLEALLRVEDSHPDAILLDIVLPQMDGATVAQRLREDPATADIPIVFLTGLVDTDEVQRRGPIIGGQYFLAKPFDAERLHEVLTLATESD